jgi:protein-tyrosine phosphatase
LAATKPLTYHLLLKTSATFAAMRILMVCLGNICRSPLAEGILQEKVTAAGLDWVVDSAGTNGYHIGEAPHPLSQKVAKMHGIDISRQRGKKFSAADFDNFDMIYAMAADVITDMKRISGNAFEPAKVDLLMHVVFPGKNVDIPDPWSGPESEYRTVFDMIEKACAKLISSDI